MSMRMEKFCRIVRQAGGRSYFVGGCVRDHLLSSSESDRDILVVGISMDDFRALFPKAHVQKEPFPVFRFWLDGHLSDICLARRERKLAPGEEPSSDAAVTRGGVEVVCSPDITIEEDLSYRDITINALAKEITSGRIVDPFGGRRDLRAQRIEAVSERFSHDARRALRAARFHAKLGFEITERTRELMHLCGAGITELSSGTVFNELRKVMEYSVPSRFFIALKEADILRDAFPFIDRLAGVSLDDGEGDAFDHAMTCVDEVSLATESPKTRFAALMHDIGSGLGGGAEGHGALGADLITDELPQAYDYGKWRRAAAAAARWHAELPIAASDPARLIDMMEDVQRSGLEGPEFDKIIFADAGTHFWFLQKDAFGSILGAASNIKECLSECGTEEAELRAALADAIERAGSTGTHKKRRRRGRSSSRRRRAGRAASRNEGA